MGRSPCCSQEGMKRGAWSALEDKILQDYVNAHGVGRWSNVSKKSGLKRRDKSCRLRWLNYLRPDIKRGNISPDEEDLIIRLHNLLGNRWSLIAGRLPGRTDNEIKNYWNTNLSKKVDHKKSSSASTLKHTHQHDQQIMRMASPSSPLKMESIDIHTHPINCSKIDTNSQPNKIDQHLDTTTEAGRPSKNGNDNNQPAESNAYDNGLSSAFANGENDQSDFMIDFNMGGHCLSDLLDFNFMDSWEFNYSIDNSNNHNETQMFSQEMPKNWTGSYTAQPNPNL